VDPQKIGSNIFNTLKQEFHATNIYKFSRYFTVSCMKAEDLIAVCCENHTEQGAEFVNAEACGIHSNQSA
jgi:hypothetical protein